MNDDDEWTWYLNVSLRVVLVIGVDPTRVLVQPLKMMAIGDQQRSHRLPAPPATATATPCTHRQSKSIDSQGGGGGW